MKDLLPGFGDRKSRERLDELFSRKTLGSVVFGGHLNKLFEKVYNAVALVIILNVLGVKVSTSIVISLSLLAIWFIGMIIVVYVFIKWEQVMDTVDEFSETADDLTE